MNMAAVVTLVMLAVMALALARTWLGPSLLTACSPSMYLDR